MRWWKRSKPGRAGRWRSYIRSWIWEIQGHLEEIYGIEVSPSLISNVTDAVVEEVKAWQSRPLEELYPIVDLGDPGASGRDLWDRGLPEPDLQRDRCGGGRGQSLAEPAAGGVISDRVSG